MYIRWVTRRHKSQLSSDTVFHDAYLIESYRDERGKPRQRTVAYLGNLREIDGTIPHVESELFLLRAAHQLHHLAVNDGMDAHGVLDDLRRQLPALTPAEARVALEHQLRWFYEWWSRHGPTPPQDEILRAVEQAIGLRARAR